MDWDQLWIEVNLATMDPDQEGAYGAIRDGAVAIKDGKIAWVGPRSALPEFDPFSLPVYRGHGGWLTPGLIDCHTHLLFGGTRASEFEQRLNGATYEQIARAGGGILSTVRATRAADEESLFQSGRKRLNSLLREGVTTVEIKSGYGLDLPTERRLLEVARHLGSMHPIEVVTTFLGAHALPEEYKGDAEGYVRHVIEEQLPAIAAEGLADAVDVFCENIAFDLAQTEAVFQAAKAHDLPVKLHAEQLSNMGGSALAARYQALSVDHIECLDEAGVKAISESGTVAVLLPGAFFTLKETRLPPIDLLRQHRVPMALASDFNPGSSPLCSTLLMLNMGCTLFGLTPEEALSGVTRCAAQALGLQEQVGQIRVGMEADLVLWEIDEPAELAWQYGCNPCREVMKHGQMVTLR
ncbi:imidazolonepropionase [Ferrimonas balearica]|uniref:imidazolonepropionase n=1 Tax=Ferrimonas balearica TaxID=44012 RepID=UPI001C991147|nr:imidazolonepropionase [Ferrimonas balearica]MBY5922793.1 imidazolonepropionase [Ferrimonas balearica]MBY5995777.1 imidazolonepropionase [Ferrimonas balearica]